MSTHLETAASAEDVGVVELSYREAVCAALEAELGDDPTVVFMGEDVGAAGGVYKTSDGLLEKFGAERVRNTPICENGFVGVALGMAATGMRPVVEIMFSDFLPTAGDAIVNELPKFRFMSGGQCIVPITVRAVGGATGRFGTQHSATGESWFMGLPGLKVATAGSPASAYGLLRAAIRDDDPVLLFEHKALFGRKGPVRLGEDGILPVGKAGICREGSDITVLATLMMADRATAAADVLAQEGLSAEVIELRWLRPLDYDSIIASVAKTGRLMIVEEQVHAAGWGATVISELTMRGVDMARPVALSMPDDLLVPYSPSLEDAIIPSVETIAATVRESLAQAWADAVRFSRLDHVGFSVADVERSVQWYTFLFEEPPVLRKLYDVEYISRVLGYPGVVLDAALWELPGGARFELLEYKRPEPGRVDMESYNVGNAHLCLIVDDLAAEFDRLRGRAEFRNPEPVEIPWGHFAGGKSCYVRDPDGISIELVQYPPGGPKDGA